MGCEPGTRLLSTLAPLERQLKIFDSPCELKCAPGTHVRPTDVLGELDLNAAVCVRRDRW